ncbi:hypothetical protein HDU86_001317 [Geranomyces michiganensis]|nr:hypothetical protein HDU86_001317 [Geranomyces michiganensis]
MEVLLNLPPDSLTREIKLAQDLEHLFTQYQIPSDLLRCNGAADHDTDGNEGLVAARINAVKSYTAHIFSIMKATETEEMEDVTARAQAKVLKEGGRGASALRETTETAPLSYPAPPGALHGSLLGPSSALVPPVHSHSATETSGKATSIAAHDSPLAAPKKTSVLEIPEFKSSLSTDMSLITSTSATCLGLTPLPLTETQEKDTTSSDPHHDFVMLQKTLTSALGTMPHAAIRPATLCIQDCWTRFRAKSILHPLTTTTLDFSAQRTERDAAFHLLDALSRSGELILENVHLHVVCAATQAFDRTLVDTIIRGNIDPLRMIRETNLVIAGVLAGVSTEEQGLLGDFGCFDVDSLRVLYEIIKILLLIITWEVYMGGDDPSATSTTPALPEKTSDASATGPLNQNKLEKDLTRFLNASNAQSSRGESTPKLRALRWPERRNFIWEHDAGNTENVDLCANLRIIMIERKYSSISTFALPPEEGKVLLRQLREGAARGTYNVDTTVGTFADRLTKDVKAGYVAAGQSRAGQAWKADYNVTITAAHRRVNKAPSFAASEPGYQSVAADGQPNTLHILASAELRRPSLVAHHSRMFSKHSIRDAITSHFDSWRGHDIQLLLITLFGCVGGAGLATVTHVASGIVVPSEGWFNALNIAIGLLCMAVEQYCAMAVIAAAKSYTASQGRAHAVIGRGVNGLLCTAAIGAVIGVCMPVLHVLVILGTKFDAELSEIHGLHCDIPDYSGAAPINVTNWV